MPTITISLSTDAQATHYYLPTGWYTISQAAGNPTNGENLIDGWLCSKCGKPSWHRRRWCYFCGEPKPLEAERAETDVQAVATDQASGGETHTTAASATK